jgi:hypothetical protein
MAEPITESSVMTSSLLLPSRADENIGTIRAIRWGG